MEVSPIVEAKNETKVESANEIISETPSEKKAVSRKTKKVTEKANVEKKTRSKSKNVPKTTMTRKTLSSPKETVKVQFGGEEFDLVSIKKAVEADYKGKYKGKIKTVDFYIKPEDKAVYYVINGDFTNKIDL